MVDKDLFEIFKKALDGNLELMGQSFADLAKQCEGMGAKARRKFLRQAYIQLVAQHGAYASVAAMEFYQMARELAQPSTLYEASAFVPEIDGLLEYDVGSILTLQDDVEKLIKKLYSTGSERVMAYADETIQENANADPAHPKWALIPNAGSCGWCQMIASQGFVYSSARTAKNTRHPNCRCTPVVDFDTRNPSLDGYDPDKLYDKYKDARKSAERDAWKDWQELTQSERDKYGSNRRGAYDHFLRNRIVANIK